MILNVLNNVFSILAGAGCCVYYFYLNQVLSVETVLKGIGIGLLFFIFTYAAIFILIWLILLGISLTINTKKEYKIISPVYYALLNFWYSYFCACFGIKLKVSGLEKLPYGQRFLTVCNHRSKLDHMIQSMVINKEKISFISKEENFKIPVARNYIIRCMYLSLPRGNKKGEVETIFKAISYINNNVSSIGVFPEGARSKTGELLPFKPGCLKIAEKTECPIVVCCINGTEKVHKNFPWKKTVVNFDIIKTYTKDEVKKSSTVELADEIRNLMLEKLGR